MNKEELIVQIKEFDKLVRTFTDSSTCEGKAVLVDLSISLHNLEKGLNEGWIKELPF